MMGKIGGDFEFQTTNTTTFNSFTDGIFPLA
jgi:hypothetical protein